MMSSKHYQVTPMSFFCSQLKARNEKQNFIFNIENQLTKDNKDVELNRLVLKYNKMPSGIMSKHKKQR
eukprot:9681894-Ditylum_brightwellii.AAC.1